MINNLIPLNLFASVKRAYIHPSQLVWLTFDQLVDFFKNNQQQLEIKEQGQLFNCCSWIKDYQSPDAARFNPNQSQWPREELIRRCKANVDHIYCLLLDVDGSHTLEQAIDNWSEYEFLIYSTHSNSDSRDKFRIIMPLKQAMSRQDFDMRHDSLCNFFNIDRASFTISQAFYLPSSHAGNRDLAYVYHNQTSTRFDAHALAAQVPNTNQISITSPILPSAKSNGIYQTLLSGSNLRYADALPLAILCKSYAITSDEYEALVLKIAGFDSTLRSDDVEIKGLYNSAYNTYMTNRKALELMKRLNCDLWRYQVSLA